MISIEHIYFSYGEKKVFEDFSLNIKSGDRICLFGESGCGKTTLLRIIAGLCVPDVGTVKRAESFRPSKVFQENLLLPFKTVLQNITLTGAEKSDALAHLPPSELPAAPISTLQSFQAACSAEPL